MPLNIDWTRVHTGRKNSYTVSELKTFAKEMGLKPSSTKAELVTQLTLERKNTSKTLPPKNKGIVLKTPQTGGLNKKDPFERLPVSTQTVMAYANCTFNINNIFNNLPVETVDTNDPKEIKTLKGKHGLIYQLKYPNAGTGTKGQIGSVRGVTTCYHQ